jgi:hypothetical protein
VCQSKEDGLSDRINRLSIIIPWSNRSDLEVSLRENERSLRDTATEIIIVNCGGDLSLLTSLLPLSYSVPLYVTSLTGMSFNRALALNVGATVASGHLLFMMDSDIMFERRDVADFFSALEIDTFLTVAVVVESQDPTSGAQHIGPDNSTCLIDVSRITATEFSWSDGTKTTIQNHRASLDGSYRSGSGLILLRKEHFWAVGGYNSHLMTWGFEDLDLQVRLKRVLRLTQVEKARVRHLTHNNDFRQLSGLSPSSSNTRNFHSSCIEYAKGNFQGTLISDIKNWSTEINDTVAWNRPAPHIRGTSK